LLLTGLIALAVSTAACTGSSEAEPERVEAPSPTTTGERTTIRTPQLTLAPRRAREVETCSTRSEASFPAAFDDPANLVAGPFVLVGAALPTSAEVLESHGGQKHPVLVRAGHNVTVRVPVSAQGHVSLGYGSLPQGNVGYADGHAAVMFAACRPGERSGSSVGPNEPVTFWSGFVFASKPSCAPLDVYVDDEPEPHRIETSLGAAC
jgi:prepilin-type processing-associated H-X9-DG protein